MMKRMNGQERKKERDRIKRLTRGVPMDNLSVYNRAATFEDRRTKRDRSRNDRERNALRRELED
jgi:hypothetical protein